MATPAELVAKHSSLPLDKMQSNGDKKTASQVVKEAKNGSTPPSSPKKEGVKYKPLGNVNKPLGNTVLKPDVAKELREKIEPVKQDVEDTAEMPEQKAPASSIDRPPSSAPLCDGTISIHVKEGVKPEYEFSGMLYGKNVRNAIAYLFRSYNKWQWSKRKGV